MTRRISPRRAYWRQLWSLRGPYLLIALAGGLYVGSVIAAFTYAAVH